MPTIKFMGPAVVFDFNSEDAAEDDTPVVNDSKILQGLDGLTYDDEIFSDYLSDGGDSTLANVGVTGGILKFKFDQKSKQLYGITEYSIPRRLSSSEIALLREYTSGQWSDGIGSNFFQERIRDGLAPQLFITDENEILVEQPD
jgi:hypothetical protein